MQVGDDEKLIWVGFVNVQALRCLFILIFVRNSSRRQLKWISRIVFKGNGDRPHCSLPRPSRKIQKAFKEQEQFLLCNQKKTGNLSRIIKRFFVQDNLQLAALVKFWKIMKSRKSFLILIIKMVFEKFFEWKLLATDCSDFSSLLSTPAAFIFHLS